METLPRLLVIEDDPHVSAVLGQALRMLYRVDLASGGKTGLYKADSQHYAAIILDLQLPDMGGADICQQLMARGSTAPILILTADSKILTKISLLDLGADDYLTKPCSLGELKARLRVLTRRHARHSPVPQRLEVQDLWLDTKSREVGRNGTAISLRRKEFDLLVCLMSAAGRAVTRDELARHAWHSNEQPWKNTVDVHIKHLRDKIDRPFEQPLLTTLHGLGYRLELTPQPQHNRL